MIMMMMTLLSLDPNAQSEQTGTEGLRCRFSRRRRRQRQRFGHLVMKKKKKTAGDEGEGGASLDQLRRVKGVVTGDSATCAINQQFRGGGGDDAGVVVDRRDAGDAGGDAVDDVTK